MNQERAILVADEKTVCDLIRSAQERLVVLAPAVSKSMAEAISERWRVLGGAAVSVILDVDPEVYRLGYGDHEALASLEATASELGTMLQKQNGVRIGLIIADSVMMVYSPTPQFIEAKPTASQAAQIMKPNAIVLAPPPQVLNDLGQGHNGVRDQRIGLDKAAKSDICSVQHDLKENPPQAFDIARTVRVFSSHFEFVELELLGTQIDHKTVAIPKHLSGIKDEKTRDQFRQSFTILPPGHSLSGEHLLKDKKLIVKKYLKQVRDYGSVLLRSQKEAFLADVEKLKTGVKTFGEKVKAELQAEMDKNRAALLKAMHPLVKRRPPQEWVASDGTKPDAETLKCFLDQDLRKAFGTAEQLIREMEVRVVIKGITWEMLNDDQFIAAMRDAVPEHKKLYDDFTAAKAKAARPAQQTEARHGV